MAVNCSSRSFAIQPIIVPRQSMLYEVLVSTFFYPFIRRFLNSFLAKSEEHLLVLVPSIKVKEQLGNSVLENNNNEPVEVALVIHDAVGFYWRMLLDPKLGLGEAYMMGCWDAQPGPTSFLKLLIRAKRQSKKSTSLQRETTAVQKTINQLSRVLISGLRKVWAVFNYVQHTIRENTISQSAKNIRDHYDLGNDMFEQFLDYSMTYSCALFENPDEKSNTENLESAQMAKIDKLLDRLNLNSDDHVLEIGCGWGACAIRAVERFGCQWTGLTISHEQLAWAQKKVEEAELSDKIDLKFLDYRLETGRYSKIISIEMIEAVGEKYLAEYFRIVSERLEPGGLVALQAIVCPDAYYDKYCKSSDFIKKYIFPGGHMPSLGHIKQVLPQELEFHDEIDKIGRHYAKTLDHWLEAWQKRSKEIEALGYSRIFHRKWQFYFALCSALFAFGHIDTVQFSLRKKA